MHQPWLACCSSHSKYTKKTPYFFVYRFWKHGLHVSSYLFSLEIINRTFFITSKRSNMLGDIFFCSFFAFKYTISFFFFPLQFVIASAAPILLHLHRERRYRCFTFCFVTTADLLLRLLTLNTYTISCFFAHRVQKRSFYDSVRTLTSKNIGGTLFVVCLSLNWFFSTV